MNLICFRNCSHINCSLVSCQTRYWELSKEEIYNIIQYFIYKQFDVYERRDLYKSIIKFLHQKYNFYPGDKKFQIEQIVSSIQCQLIILANKRHKKINARRRFKLKTYSFK